MYYIQSRFGKFTQIVKSKLSISHSSCQQNVLPASSLSVESPKRLKVVFFGTDLLSIKILAGLHDLTKQGIIQEVCVVTSSSAKKNIRNREQLNNRASEQSQVSIDLDNFRGNQIIDFCSKNNIPCHKWPNIKPNRMYVELLKSCRSGRIFWSSYSGKINQAFTAWYIEHSSVTITKMERSFTIDIQRTFW